MKRKIATIIFGFSIAMVGCSPTNTQVDSDYYNQFYQSFGDEYVAEENIWLTEEERIYGLSLIWRHVAEMSPFFSEQPDDFDWNQLYLEYLTKVLRAEDIVEYYEILIRFVASLSDGKSTIQMPQNFIEHFHVFPVTVRYIDDRYIIFAINQDFLDVPLGSEIVSVDGIETHKFLEYNFGDMISNHTPIVRENMLANHFQTVFREKSMELEILTPQGEIVYKTIDFIPFTEELMDAFNGMAMLNFQSSSDTESIVLEQGAVATVYQGGIHHISISTFGNPAMPEAVKQYIESVAYTATGFILDIRGNMGGAGDLLILSQFADPREFPVVTAYRQIRDGGLMGVANILMVSEMLGGDTVEDVWEMTVDGRSVHHGRGMLESRHLESIEDISGMDIWDNDLLYEQSLRLFHIPVVILTDYRSASAAETFVISAQGINNFTIMGNHTAGMAGDTSMFMLPGGGFFSLNVVKQLTPDGQVINNNGISPDILVSQSLDDMLLGIDTQLITAIEYLSNQLNEIEQ